MRDVDGFVDEISTKFGYSETLSRDLKRIIPLMIEDADENKSKMLIDMLEDTKIFVLPNMATVDDLDKCKSEIFGSDNRDITFLDADQGEYGKTEVADGAYISEPIFDDEMNIVGRNRMIFVKELSSWDSLRETYNSDINLSHLIHEIGHAWAAEQDEYIQNEDGTFTEYVGAGAIIHSVDKESKEVKGLKAEGIFIEEALNTIMEEQTLLKLTKMPSMEELRKKGYVSSSYQGLMKGIMGSYVEKFGNQDFEEYRFSKDKGALANIEEALCETDAWKTLMSFEYTEAKKRSISSIDGLEVSSEAKAKTKQFFEHYDSVYFPDNTKFTPIQKLDNILEQIYNFNAVKYNFNMLGNQNNLEIYKKVVSAMVAEANALKNEARVIAKSEHSGQSMAERLKQGVQDDKKVSEYYRGEEENKNSTIIERNNKESR